MYPAVGEDYELPQQSGILDQQSTESSIFLSRDPAFVSVILLRDGVAGEPTETITLTLMHYTAFPPTAYQILLYSTVTINVQDNDRTYVCMFTYICVQ